MVELSKETMVAMSAYKAWARAADRVDPGKANFYRYVHEEERARARLHLAVVRIPDAEFPNYFGITEAWEARREAGHK